MLALLLSRVIDLWGWTNLLLSVSEGCIAITPKGVIELLRPGEVLRKFLFVGKSVHSSYSHKLLLLPKQNLVVYLIKGQATKRRRLAHGLGRLPQVRVGTTVVLLMPLSDVISLRLDFRGTESQLAAASVLLQIISQQRRERVLLCRLAATLAQAAMRCSGGITHG